jgi:hypothetical protein
MRQSLCATETPFLTAFRGAAEPVDHKNSGGIENTGFGSVHEINPVSKLARV